jgi:hypothetical protein
MLATFTEKKAINVVRNIPIEEGQGIGSNPIGRDKMKIIKLIFATVCPKTKLAVLYVKNPVKRYNKNVSMRIENSNELSGTRKEIPR